MSATQFNVGVQDQTASGQGIIAGGDRQGAQFVSELNGRYAGLANAGRLFVGSNGATPTVTTVALATTYTGLALINPASSGKNLSLLTVGLSFIVAFPAGSAIGLLAGYAPAGIATFSAAATDGANCLIGGTRGVGRAALSATLVGTPLLFTLFGSGFTGAITTSPFNLPSMIDIGGALTIPPGGYAAVYTSTVTGAASMSASFLWAESPI